MSFTFNLDKFQWKDFSKWLLKLFWVKILCSVPKRYFMSVIYLHFSIASFWFLVKWIDLGSKNPLQLALSRYQDTKIFGTKNGVVPWISIYIFYLFFFIYCKKILYILSGMYFYLVCCVTYMVWSNADPWWSLLKKLLFRSMKNSEDFQLIGEESIIKFRLWTRQDICLTDECWDIILLTWLEDLMVTGAPTSIHWI